MSFEVGRLSAALTLEGVSQFNRDLDQAGQKLQQTGSRGAAFGKAAEAAVRTAAGATTGLATAAAAYVAILAKTGVSYNSLQQNSRAALSVLLGGTEKANEQMARLDDFARNSPFAKDVFIQAQQQLIGFGMEARKVVPTLDAVQQSVAAMGGSNDDIREIVRVLAQVQSTGEFTGVTLRQLGIRGVDAAQLIGDRMGKTGQEIRDALSSGALDGREAMDLLVEGMDQKFGGAADRVKEQWSGAVDRIKAANRDLGSVIAEPFVSAQGGGMAVTWGNQVADVLRAIEKQAVPVMAILTTRAAPAFAALTQHMDRAAQSVQRWDASRLETTLDRMSGHAPGIAALVGATVALGAQVGPLGRLFTTLGISANPVMAALVGIAAASPEVRDSLKGVLEAGKPLVNVATELAMVLSGTLNAALPLVAGGVDLLATVLTPLVRMIDAIPAPVIAGAAAFLMLHNATKGLNAPLTAVVAAVQRFGQQSQVQAALGGTSTGVGALSTASMGAQGAVKGLGTAMKTAFMTNPIGLALTVISAAIGAWAIANAKAQQEVQEHNDRVANLKGTLNETTGAITEATQAQVEATLAESDAKELADEIGVSYRDVEQAILGNESAYQRVNSALDEHIEATTLGDKNLDTWSSTATKAQGNVADLTEIIEQNRAAMDDAKAAVQEKIQADRDAAAAMSEAGRSNQRFNDALEVARDITQDAESRVRALKQALDELQGGAISAEEAQKRLSETNLTLAEGFAQADEAGTKLWASTLDGAGQIDIGSRSGLAFADAMGRSRDAMLDAAMAASDQALANGDVVGAVQAATGAGNEYIETLKATMQEAGLTDEQIEGLISTYLDVPSVVTTLLTNEGTFSESEQQILAILAQLSEIPKGKTITMDHPGSEETIQALRDLGYAIEETDDGKTVTITSTGKDQVISDLEIVNGTYVPEKILEIDANAAGAYEGIEGVNVTRVNEKTAYVWGNNADALGRIGDVNRTQMPRKLTWIDGNDSNFQNKWQQIRSMSPISKTVDIIQNFITRGKKHHDGGMYVGGAKHFHDGGFPSGIYEGVMGGIHKMGMDGSHHIFGEKELGVDWEAYISSKASARPRNIGIALSALDRLGFPVVPRSSVHGFDKGGMVGRGSTPTPAPRDTSRPVEIRVYGHRGMDIDQLADEVMTRFEGRL